MGISHEYNYARRRAKQRSKYGKLKLAACVAAILLLSLAITAILETAQREAAPAVPDTLPSGTVEGILAPLPMQPGEGGCRGGSAGLRPGPPEPGGLYRPRL